METKAEIFSLDEVHVEKVLWKFHYILKVYYQFAISSSHILELNKATVYLIFIFTLICQNAI